MTKNNSNKVQNAQSLDNFIEKYVKNSNGEKEFTEIVYIDAQVYEMAEEEADALGITVEVLIDAILREHFDKLFGESK